MKSSLSLASGAGAAALAGWTSLWCGCGGALAAAQGVTHATILVEEFTAEWCGPCVEGAHSMDRLKDRWGDEVSVVTYTIWDIYTNPDGEQRGTECGIWGVPSFLFQGTYMQIGVNYNQEAFDATLDNLVRSAQALPTDARIIGHWKLKPDGVVRVNLKLEADVAIAADDYELRVVVHETPWEVPCSNGLDGFNWHMQQVFYEPLPAMNVGEQWGLRKDYDLSTNEWVHDFENLAVSVFLHDKSNLKSVEAMWDLGAVNLGDLNNDLSITRQDAVLFRRQMGNTEGDPGFNPAADWDGDGVIDGADKDLFRAYVEEGGMR